MEALADAAAAHRRQGGVVLCVEGDLAGEIDVHLSEMERRSESTGAMVLADRGGWGAGRAVPAASKDRPRGGRGGADFRRRARGGAGGLQRLPDALFVHRRSLPITRRARAD